MDGEAERLFLDDLVGHPGCHGSDRIADHHHGTGRSAGVDWVLRVDGRWQCDGLWCEERTPSARPNRSSGSCSLVLRRWDKKTAGSEQTWIKMIKYETVRCRARSGFHSPLRMVVGLG